MGRIRFLYDNLLDGASVVITPSSQATAMITGSQKNGAGSGDCVPGGTYSGTTERQYVIIIDLTGELGVATFKWSDDGGSTFSGTGVLTSGSPIVLSNGVTVYFTSGTGTDFSLGDRWDFKILFPRGVAKLFDRNRNTEYRTADVTGAKTLTIDLGSAQAVQALAILDHNLTNGATITLAGNSADSWGAPAFGPVAITWNAAKILYYLSATQTYRYWRLSLTDAGNADGYLRISELFLGPYAELSGTSNFNRGWSRGRAPILDGDLAALQPAVTVLGMPEILQVQFTLLPTADRDTLLETIYPALYNASTRRVKPCMINVDSATPNDFLFAFWEGDGMGTSPFLSHFDLPARFRELVRSVLSA